MMSTLSRSFVQMIGLLLKRKDSHQPPFCFSLDELGVGVGAAVTEAVQHLNHA